MLPTTNTLIRKRQAKAPLSRTIEEEEEVPLGGFEVTVELNSDDLGWMGQMETEYSNYGGNSGSTDQTGDGSGDYGGGTGEYGNGDWADPEYGD